MTPSALKHILDDYWRALAKRKNLQLRLKLCWVSSCLRFEATCWCVRVRSDMLICAVSRCVQTVFKTCHLFVTPTVSVPWRNISMTITCERVPLQHSPTYRRKSRRPDFPVCTLSLLLQYSVKFLDDLWLCLYVVAVWRTKSSSNIHVASIGGQYWCHVAAVTYM